MKLQLFYLLPGNAFEENLVRMAEEGASSDLMNDNESQEYLEKNEATSSGSSLHSLSNQLNDSSSSSDKSLVSFI